MLKFVIKIRTFEEPPNLGHGLDDFLSHLAIEFALAAKLMVVREFVNREQVRVIVLTVALKI